MIVSDSQFKNLVIQYKKKLKTQKDVIRKKLQRQHSSSVKIIISSS